MAMAKLPCFEIPKLIGLKTNKKKVFFFFSFLNSSLEKAEKKWKVLAFTKDEE